VDRVPIWDQKSFGKPTMIVWNRRDEVLQSYGASLEKSVDLLRRHDHSQAVGARFYSGQSYSHVLDPSPAVPHAELILWGASGDAPPTAVLLWESAQPTHNWPNEKQLPGAFDAADEVWKFFRSVRVYHDAAPAAMQYEAAGKVGFVLAVGVLCLLGRKARRWLWLPSQPLEDLNPPLLEGDLRL
jgi:hypothetical protein